MRSLASSDRVSPYGSPGLSSAATSCLTGLMPIVVRDFVLEDPHKPGGFRGTAGKRSPILERCEERLLYEVLRRGAVP